MPADADALLLGGPVGNEVALVGDFHVILEDEDIEAVMRGTWLDAELLHRRSVQRQRCD